MIFKEGHLYFEDGTRLDANRSIVGINPQDDDLIYEGYDGAIHRQLEPWETRTYELLSVDHLIELSRYMEQLWAARRQKYERIKDNIIEDKDA